MNELEMENIERRAYQNAVFASGCSRETADRYIDKIYSIYFSQNEGNNMIADRTGADFDELFKNKKPYFFLAFYFDFFYFFIF